MIRSRAVLYITYDGLLEPLGQSQVLAYQELLSRGREIHILSFEKKHDWYRLKERAAIEARMCEAGIKWHSRRYHKNYSAFATAYDILVGIVSGLWLICRYRLHIVHARSYVPSVMALALKYLTGSKFIFDMRGFWADERVDGGLWPKGGRLYRVAKWFEQKFLLNADYVVSLTKAAIVEMESFAYLEEKMPPVAMIPTCVDVERFLPANTQPSGEFVLGYVGSVGTWYLFEHVVEAFTVLLSHIPAASLLVINRGEHEYIFGELDRKGVSPDRYQVKSASHAEVPEEMKRMHAGIFFIKPLYSKKASAPTKMGEFLACGIPCISNAGVGDMAHILTANNVGIALDGFTNAEIENGIADILELASDGKSAERCRDTAESYFSLEQGVRSYATIYDKLALGS